MRTFTHTRGTTMRCQTCGNETSPAISNCQSCGTPLDSPALSPGITTYAVRGMGLAAAVGVGLATAVYLLLALFPVARAVLARWGATADDADLAGLLRGVTLVEGLVSLSYLVVHLTTGALVMIWMFRARKNTDAFPGARPYLNAHWAITGWWVPIANLFVPCRVMAGIARDTLGRGRASVLVGLWWAGWLVFTFADLFRSVGAEAYDPVLGPRTTENLQLYVDYHREAALWNLVPALACLVAAVSLVVLIRRISAAQQARIERGTSAWPVFGGTAVPAPQPVSDQTVASLPDGPAAGGTIGA
ncbi:DUF4328 domain-containing protein [Micromonospora phytophila]|uniref:DUF4328 domain-containing protein n=1 Tax=Micromonospora phytophila TaxID=709888 RepID=UPI0020306624|nr:DUF4328 domain-containing protein [Micromonospora phytophila]MCM0676985.1 DUF4328 domain-containing protein [Micromonospora phytophila]